MVDLPQRGLKVGPALDALVTRALANRQPAGVDPDYDLVQQHFDYVHFLLQARLLRERPDADPVREFLTRGARSRNSPDVHFSMPNYVRRYPEKRQSQPTPYLDWIRGGRAAGEIADPAFGIEEIADVLGLDPHTVVDELVRIRTDVTTRLRTGVLGEMFARAVEVEPLVGAAWPLTAEIKIAPLGHDQVAGAVGAIHTCQREAGFRRARLVVVADRPRPDGGRRLAEQVARSGAVAPEDVVVIYTDRHEDEVPEPAVPGLRQVDFRAATAQVVDHYQEQALVALLRSFRAEAVINAESTVLYRALTSYGRALTASERVYLHFAANQQGTLGTWFGWSERWLYAGFGLVEGFLTDTEEMKAQLVERYQLTESQAASVEVLRDPVDPAIAPVGPRTSTAARPVVGWAGPWDRQRRPDLAVEIARAMPHVDFRLWTPVAGTVTETAAAEALPGNVHLVDDSWDPVRAGGLSDVDAWLYTSAWDGAPAVLLDVAMTEVPVVAALVGGVAEVLSTEDGWPVQDADSPAAYVAAIDEVLADPEAARRRARALRERLLRERPQERFAEDVTRLVARRRAAEVGVS